MRLYLPQEHSQSLTGPKMRSQKKPALLRLERTVVDGLRIFNLTLGPRTDGLRGSHGDSDVIHVIDPVESEQLT